MDDAQKHDKFDLISKTKKNLADSDVTPIVDLN